mgnify:CR=1 FL=1
MASCVASLATRPTYSVRASSLSAQPSTPPMRTSPALGHPRVYLQIDEKGFVDCGYCDKRFILKGGPADRR